MSWFHSAATVKRQRNTWHVVRSSKCEQFLPALFCWQVVTWKSSAKMSTGVKKNPTVQQAKVTDSWNQILWFFFFIVLHHHFHDHFHFHSTGSKIVPISIYAITHVCYTWKSSRSSMKNATVVNASKITIRVHMTTVHFLKFHLPCLLFMAWPI